VFVGFGEGATDVFVGAGRDVLVGVCRDVLVGKCSGVFVCFGEGVLVGADKLTFGTGLPRAKSSKMTSCSKPESSGLRRAASTPSAL
jgi:hypothetical protein